MDKNDEVIKILIVDDTPEIHHAFLEILVKRASSENNLFHSMEEEIFSELPDLRTKSKPSLPTFSITSAMQGEEGIEEVKKAIANGHPYALAFVDIRMPPGLDGVETIKRIWEVDPNIQIVICTAYSDYTWEETVEKLGEKDNLLIIKKPFDAVSIRQLACALTKKWQLSKETRQNVMMLEERVSERTRSLKQSLSVTRGTLESSPDGILVLDVNNQLIDFNKHFVEFWQIPPSMLEGRKAITILKHIGKKLVEPGEFNQLIEDIISRNHSQKSINVSSKTHRIFEVNKQVYKLGEENAGYIFSFRDITSRAFMEARIQYQATHDPLTKLANRVLLFDRIEASIQQSKRENTQFGVLFFDLNRFKLINDSLGHAAGDMLLIKVAERLKKSLRKSDTLSRIGGDEFVIVTSALHSTNIKVFADKILGQFIEPFIVKEQELYLTTSIGVSVYPGDGCTTEDLLTNADTAMYNAKEIGGNRYSFYNDRLKIEKTCLQLQFDFHKALKCNEFFLNYQPQYDIESNTIQGIEALVRWQHPERGTLLPIDFIETAEETGFIIPLGEWILKEACKQNKSWQDQGFPKMVMAVNMGTKQLKQPDLAKKVKTILEETQLEPQYLEIELTENTFINLVQTHNEISELKKLGIKISLDDFGAGYSSLNYLRQIKIDRLKIDKSFIDNIDVDQRDEQIIEAIISMSNVLGFHVVAEGVETQRQFNFLQEKRCEDVQGYYFSRPLMKEQIECLLKDQRKK
ncbi:regulatory protein (GGDEF and EAL domains) [Legionella birminghamensis]|uniref:Regulatory protein (GGDEF and EAL domains) n=1 Tax=Legionella birminghamensis TaxID=28083 RepID=A0A378IAV0_9GAMM|nr:EAL domain-containing protein [Legionella birminghamensis]KTC73055.1 regulatory protein (GGDEF and EAL domains) [Legionella birminghamensis]STX32368.1 regulatory protein (GGDEF and EAL domains) [Legionella birminghamensis]